MRRQIACPDCGLIVSINHGAGPIGTYVEINGERLEVMKNDSAFDCPRCLGHYTYRDFWNENEEKWDRTMKEEV